MTPKSTSVIIAIPQTIEADTEPEPTPPSVPQPPTPDENQTLEISWNPTGERIYSLDLEFKDGSKMTPCINSRTLQKSTRYTLSGSCGDRKINMADIISVTIYSSLPISGEEWNRLDTRKGTSEVSILSKPIFVTLPDDETPPPSGGDLPSSECKMSEEDRNMVLTVNQARAQKRDCGNREMVASSPLKWSCQLAAAAQRHSDDMLANKFLGHVGTDGSRLSDRIFGAGYSGSFMGENVAMGSRTVDQVVAVWLNSLGHCINIMSSGFKKIGSAAASNTSGQGPYWTQTFGN